MRTLSTLLFDRQAGHNLLAALRFDLTAEEILATETIWGTIRRASVERLVATGFPVEQMPQHWHWDWRWKIPKLLLVTHRCVGIEVGGEIQGLMLLATKN